MKIYLFIVLIFLLTTCTSGEGCHIPIQKMGPKLTVYMTEMFEEHNIPYKLIEGNIICVSQSAIDELSRVMELFITTYLPEDRSISADTELLDRYQISLRRENVEYKKYILDSLTFLAWEEKDKKIVAKIIEEENNRFFLEKATKQ